MKGKVTVMETICSPQGTLRAERKARAHLKSYIKGRGKRILHPSDANTGIPPL
jgi:hypothetical protein